MDQSSMGWPDMFSLMVWPVMDWAQWDGCGPIFRPPFVGFELRSRLHQFFLLKEIDYQTWFVLLSSTKFSLLIFMKWGCSDMHTDFKHSVLYLLTDHYINPHCCLTLHCSDSWLFQWHSCTCPSYTISKQDVRIPAFVIYLFRYHQSDLLKVLNFPSLLLPFIFFTL